MFFIFVPLKSVVIDYAVARMYWCIFEYQNMIRLRFMKVNLKEKLLCYSVNPVFVDV